MRLKVWDRIFSAFSGLLILVIGVGLFVFGAGIFPFRLDLSFLDQPFVFWQRAVMVVAAIALCLLGLRGFSMMFRSNKERGFIMQHTEYGDLSISMTAMENMVKKCVDTHDELKVNATRIHHARDGVVITIRIALASGVNIPIAVSALQKQIKQYITSCSGVDVKEVRVMVETNNSLAPYTGAKVQNSLMADVDAATKAGVVVDSLHEAAQNAMTAEPSVKAPVTKAPLHQRLFRREEKPQIVPEAPVMPEAPATPPETAAQPETAIQPEVPIIQSAEPTASEIQNALPETAQETQAQQQGTNKEEV